MMFRWTGGCRQISTTAVYRSGASEGSILQRLKQGTWPRVLSKAHIVAPEDYNRFKLIPASFLLQTSIGSVYAWSMWNDPITRVAGVVASSASDWSLDAVVPVWSTAAIMLGVCTFTLGPWAERAGPRAAGIAAAVAYGSGCLLSGFACHIHSLPLVYLGYGVMGGIGWGLGYISPVSTLMRWFPDRRGLATGLALTAFGAGAAVAAPLIRMLTGFFEKAPTYIGSTGDVSLVVQGGKQFAMVNDVLREVVVATSADLAKLTNHLAEGVYLVGTGSSGVSEAFCVLGLTYLVTMAVGALGARVPHPNWKPPKWRQAELEAVAAKASVSPVTPPAATQPALFIDHREALRTPQFYLMWNSVMCNAIAGTALITSAKLIMMDIFSTGYPTLVTASFASSYVAALSIANSGGRFGWAVLSDYIGRKNTYFLFGAAIPICACVPMLTAWAATPTTALPLALFYGGTLLSFSFYGGLFSVLPAYIADIFGQRHVGAIHGRLLTAWSCAALLGPKLLTTLRRMSYDDAVKELSGKCDESVFQNTFGAPVSDLQALLDAKTVTINRLLEICPTGTLDPTPALYDSTMYACTGILALAVLSNAFIKKLDASKMHLDIQSKVDTGNPTGQAIVVPRPKKS